MKVLLRGISAFTTVVSILVLVTSTTLFGQDWNQITSGLPVSDPALDEYFGDAISIDNGVALVGAPGSSKTYLSGGRAFILEKINHEWVETIELLPSQGFESMGFGACVLVKGDYAFVGAPAASFGGTSRGAVYVFKKQSGSWANATPITTLLADDPFNGANFGGSIAFSGSTLVVGSKRAWGGTTDSGAAYVFELTDDSFIYRGKILPAVPESASDFGCSVAVDANTIFVGCRTYQVGNDYPGAVFVFDRATLTQKAVLVPEVSASAFLFGYALRIVNDVLAVSCPFNLNANGIYGGLYIFERPSSGWQNASENFMISPSTPAIGEYGSYGHQFDFDGEHLLIGSQSGTLVDLWKKGSTWADATLVKVFTEDGLDYTKQYGKAIALSGNDLLIGAPNFNILGETSGIIYPYEKTGPEWNDNTLLTRITKASENAGRDMFGYDVDIDGNFAVVGAPLDDCVARDAGCAYVFEFKSNTWERIARLLPSGGVENARFGNSVSIQGNRIVVGAPYDEADGKAYVFEKPVDGWKDAYETAAIGKINAALEGYFAYSVRTNENVLSISQFPPGSSEAQGIIYLFEKSGVNWDLKATLTPTVTEDGRGFGADHAFRGNVLVTGASLSGSSREGTAFVFEKPSSGGWQDANENAILYPSDGKVLGAFGTSVDVLDNTIIVGCPQGWDGTSGAAYIFEKGIGWSTTSEDAKLVGATELPLRVGTSVALSGEYALVSTPKNNGSVMAFRKISGEWRNTQQYTSVLAQSIGGNFGFSIAASGDHLISGSPLASTAVGGGSGLAQFFLKTPTIAYVTSDNEDGVYEIGSDIILKVVSSQPVTVTGAPELKLSMYDDSDRIATFNGMEGNAMLFSYTVQQNDSTPDLSYKDEMALQGIFSYSSKINSYFGDITLPRVSSANSLKSLKGLVVDGIVQVVGTETQTSRDISVYPNPFVSAFVVESNENLEILEMLDSKGVPVQFSKGMDGEVFTTDIPAGIYLLRVKGRKGMENVRLVKEQ